LELAGNSDPRLAASAPTNGSTTSP
jgi:hypothetical protein